MTQEDGRPVSEGDGGVLRTGTVLGRYELLVPIGAGGMAQVWAARLKGTRGFQKIVAVKTMLPQLSGDPEFLQMFLDEATLASRVRHPHVVEILDLGEQQGRLFLVMEWVDGEPLSEVLRVACATEQGLPLAVAVRIAMQTCAGLQAAHDLADENGTQVGLVHRDVSPQNILIGHAGIAQLADFGVAKALGHAKATQSVELRGKVGYAAPEQIMDGVVDRRTDVFALGVVLYEMTTGRHPFRAENDLATLQAICVEPVTPPSTWRTPFPAPLEEVVLRALAKEPDDRFTTASEMLRALDLALPANDRAHDEDVASVLRTLLGTEHEKRRAALAEALATVDKSDGSGSVAAATFAPTSRRPSPRLLVGIVAAVSLLALVLAVTVRRGSSRNEGPIANLGAATHDSPAAVAQSSDGGATAAVAAASETAPISVASAAPSTRVEPGPRPTHTPPTAGSARSGRAPAPSRSPVRTPGF